jgi:hypothetical protein
MIKLTRDQRVALFKVFQRDFPSWVGPSRRIKHGPAPRHDAVIPVPTTQWRRFRKSIRPTFGCDGCVMLYWRGMWLGIERDGYTHS